jgi:hypothetical protein
MQHRQPTVSILAEIPESLHQSISNLIESSPGWSWDQVVSEALPMFLARRIALASNGDRPPLVEVEGKPISESIIEERR